MSWAQLVIRPIRLAALAAILLPLVGASWWLMHSTARTFSRTARASRDVVRQSSAIDVLSDKLRGIARDASVSEDVAKWQREVSRARQQLDLSALQTIQGRLTKLLAQLNSSYEVHVCDQFQVPSRVPRGDAADHGRAYYVIVSAKSTKGDPVRCQIDSAADNSSAAVETWAEQVPKEIYDRLVDEKEAHGVLHETLFAIKRRGFRDLEMQLAGPDGKPTERLGQITRW